MPRQTTHFLLRGGLDLVTSPLEIGPGRIWFGVNYEPVEAGYRRILGYERVDGRLKPSEATYHLLGYTPASGGRVAAVGDVITGGSNSATATILAVTDDDYVIGELGMGTIAEDEPLAVGNRSVGTATGTPRARGAETIDLDFAYLVLAQTLRRDEIEALPGSGETRGVWVYKGDLYAVRDNEAGTAGVLSKATPSGWEAITAAVLPAGGRYEFINRNFEGQIDAEMMYGVNGVGKAFVFDGTDLTLITTGQPTDEPTHISAHRNHLLLAYRGGSLVVSGTGLPKNYEAVNGAAEIAVGQEIYGLARVGTGYTMIMGSDRMSVLYGNDSEDFEVADHSDPQTGGVEWTVQTIGAPLYMDNRGVRRFDVTDKFGNFVINTMTSDIQPWINTQRNEKNLTTASMRVRASDQYRIFFESGIGLVVYVGRGVPELAFIDYRVKVRCAVSSEDSDRIERVYFGSDDGWVFEAERGSSFDGREIEAYIRLPLNHQKSPTRKKRYYKADIHLDLQSRVKMGISAIFDDGNTPDQPQVDQALYGGGGLWDEALFDEFYWDSPLNGYGEYDLMGLGRNVSLLLQSKSNIEIPHILNGISLQWAPRGLER